MNPINKSAYDLHKQVPPNWYYLSLKVDPIQRYWHRRRFEEVSKIASPVKGTILDIGCADGMFSKVILDKTKAKKLIGLDVLKSSVSWANKHWASTGKMQFKVGDAHKLEFKKETFDAVFALEVLEHVHNPEKVLREIKRVLKPNGYGIFLVPSDSRLFRSIWFLWIHFYPRGWVWRETHIQTFSNNYLPRLSKKVGLKIEIDKKFILGMLHVVKVKK